MATMVNDAQSMASMNGRLLPPAAIYLRISDDAEGKALGVTRQREDCFKRAADLGFHVGEADVYEDNDKGASTLSTAKRDGYDAMMQAVREGKYRAVIAYSNSRLTRRVRDLTDIIDMHKDLTSKRGLDFNIHTVVSGSDDLSTADGRMVAYYKAVADQAEAERVGERGKRKHQQIREQGKIAGGSRPFGWTKDKIKLDPVESIYARKIVSMFLSGQSLHAIVRYLNNESVTSTKGNAWTMDALRKYLANPRLCGWRKYKGEIVRDRDGNPVVGEWEPLIAPEDWLACEERLEARRGKQFGPKGVQGVLAPSFDARRHLLTGFLRCGKPKADGSTCMARMRATPRKDVYGGTMYQCPTPTQGGCAGVGRNASVLDLYVTEAVLARAESMSTANEPDMAWGGKAQLDGAMSRKHALETRWKAGQMKDDTFFNLLEDIEVEINVLQRERNKWEATQVLKAHAPTDIRAEWKKREDDLGWKRSVIDRHIRSIIILPVGGGRRPFDETKVRVIWREE